MFIHLLREECVRDMTDFPFSSTFAEH